MTPAYLGFNDSLSPWQQMAADEAMLDGPPAFRLYDYPHDAVVFGRNQHPSILKGTYPAARRFTGGTATIEKRGDLRWAISLPYEFRSLKDMNQYLCRLLTASLENAGIRNAYADPEMSTVKLHGKIIGGYARCVKGETGFAHGMIAMTPYSTRSAVSAIWLRRGEEHLLSSTPSLSKAMMKEPEEAREALMKSMLNVMAAAGLNIMNIRELIESPDYVTALQKHLYPPWIIHGISSPNVPDPGILVVDEEGIRHLLNKKGHCFYSMYTDEQLAALR
ncbi:MAG TPA: hypothetical protein VI979_02520 [archaeon]|nr:hypothetical protein [archaeon]